MFYDQGVDGRFTQTCGETLTAGGYKRRGLTDASHRMELLMSVQTSVIDTSSDFGQRVARRLADEQVIWLTTVDSKETPQPNPVWFIWDGQTVLIYSQPDQAKIRNIDRSGQVSLNFNSDFHGGDVIILAGTAQVDPSAPAADRNPAFIEKYAGGIASINLTPESFAAAYSVPIRVSLTRVRGF